MTIECPRCHSGNSDNSRFCGNCATPLKGETPAGAGPGGGPEGALLTKTIETPAGGEARPGGEAEPGFPGASLTRTIETPVHVLRTGSLIAGKYRILEELGRGGMGVVYKAEDVKLQRTVALKFLPPHLADSVELKERFLIEARAAAALNHPNICVIHEVGEDEARPYIAMEFVEGETLKDKLRGGPLKADEALTIASQVAAGLGEAHHKDIIHRDIKSANIMVTEKGQAKVMDFGLAKLRGGSSLTKSQTTIGTLAYMSPEQARGNDVDPRTDIWSLGVVLYEMLSGKLPFRGDHDQTVVYAILHHEPEPLKKSRPDLPPGAERIVGQALAKKPAERYQAMDELGIDLEAVAEGLKPLNARSRLAVRKILGVRAACVYAVSVLLALLFGLNVGGLRNRILGKAAASANPVRLAVLPFANLSGDPAQEYLSAGLTQEMIAQLGRLHPDGLSVIARTSVMRYRNAGTPIKEIGRDLGVEYILLACLFFINAMYEESLAEFEQFHAGDGEMREALKLGFAESGFRGAMRRAAGLLIARSRETFVLPGDIAVLYTFAGEKDLALEWLEKAVEAHDPNMPYLNVWVEYDPLRSDPRFQALVRRMHLPKNSET